MSEVTCSVCTSRFDCSQRGKSPDTSRCFKLDEGLICQERDDYNNKVAELLDLFMLMGLPMDTDIEVIREHVKKGLGK